MNDFTLAQQQLRVVNAIAGQFFHSFAMPDERLRELFLLADLITHRERRGAELSESQGRTIYERLIECLTIANMSGPPPTPIGAWKSDKLARNSHAEYAWESENCRHRIEIRGTMIAIEIRSEGTLEPACTGWIDMYGASVRVAGPPRGSKINCCPDDVLCLIELAGSLHDVIGSDVVGRFCRHLVTWARDVLVIDHLRSALIERRELAEGVKDYDGMWLWIQALNCITDGGERS